TRPRQTRIVHLASSANFTGPPHLAPAQPPIPYSCALHRYLYHWATSCDPRHPLSIARFRSPATIQQSASAGYSLRTGTRRGASAPPSQRPTLCRPSTIAAIHGSFIAIVGSRRNGGKTAPCLHVERGECRREPDPLAPRGLRRTLRPQGRVARR